MVFTGVWVTASVLKSPGLVSVFWHLINAVVWIVSTRPPTSKSSRPFNNPLVNVPNALITIGTIVTFMFHSFFNSLARSRYLSFFSLSFRFILWSGGIAKSTILQILFLYYYYYYYFYYYYTLCKFPPPVLADGISLWFVWQQVSLGFHEFS